MFSKGMVVRHAWLWLLVGATVFPYVVFVMVVVDRYPPPFNALASFFLPWKSIARIPHGTSLPEKLGLMQLALDHTKLVSRIAFSVMVGSFFLFGANAVRFYQQQKRRSQENRLLELKNQEIARRTEFIRHISATIGHEFKNNVARIKRRIELLPDMPLEARERILLNFEKLFSDIEIFKKIADEREAGLVKFQSVDLRVLLDEIAGQYSDFVETRFVSDVQPPRLYASVPLIWAVFENIFDNAVKYKKPGQDKAQVTVAFSESRDGERRYLSTAIRDQGIGMTEEQAEMCFYKGSSLHGGWGEGLYFSKYVVGLHAGRIRIGREYTALGVGTEVILHLPYVEEEFHV